MIDDNKIEAAKEEIYEDRFLLNGEEIVFNNDEKEEMFYKEDIKEAIGLGAKWGINELLKDMFHLLAKFHVTTTERFLRSQKNSVIESSTI